MEKEQQVFFGIKEIKELGFSIDESVEFPVGTKNSCQYNAKFSSNLEEETVTFTIEATFKETERSRTFMSGKSISRFVIRDLKAYAGVRKDGSEIVNLPLPLWVTLYSLSYSHARALLAKSAAGTKFSSVLLPIINPEESFKTAFAKELAREG